MNIDYIADNPVSKEIEDRFQRYPFAKRIAETIIKRNLGEGIVIGIYGTWGEGKTSIMNFIDSELSNQNNIVRIKFNPWRYTDEDTLLYNFFAIIAENLGTSLLNKIERSIEFITKHKDLVSSNIPYIGDLSKTIGAIGKALFTKEIEDLKNRLEEIIIKSEKKIIIFIDDIDRLDKNEIHSVLRLVKLTANFSNTVYILAFDENVVSSIIGERYATNDRNSGKDFLEKIIQVPLNIPQAQPEALQNYCFTILNNLLSSNTINLSETDQHRFGTIFTKCLLSIFETPRMIVRYGNSLSFSIPLLKGEVNIVDLIFIEGIKIIYPNIYDYIKTNSSCFIEVSKRGLKEDDKGQKDYIKGQIDTLIKGYDKYQQNNIIDLLSELFPILKSIYSNMVYSNRQYIEWYNDKRICSKDYFKRYFSYTVIEGELSDLKFDDFISKIDTKSISEIINDTKQILEITSPHNFIFKIRSQEKEFKWENSKKIILAFIDIIDLFPKNKPHYFFDFQTPYGQLIILIYQLINNHNNKNEQLFFAREILRINNDFEFNYNFLDYLKPKEKESEENIFSSLEFTQIWKDLNNRILDESLNSNIFVQYPNICHSIIGYWATYDKKRFRKYIKDIINNDSYNIMLVLRSYLPSWISWNNGSTRIGDLDGRVYKILTDNIDKNFIMKSLFKLYKKKEFQKRDVRWSDDIKDKLDDFDIALQFYHHYNLDDSAIVIDQV